LVVKVKKKDKNNIHIIILLYKNRSGAYFGKQIKLKKDVEIKLFVQNKHRI